MKDYEGQSDILSKTNIYKGQGEAYFFRSLSICFAFLSK